MESFIAQFETKDWNETTDRTLDGEQKLTTTRMVRMCAGDIEGRSDVSYLMAYTDATTATFVGMERFEGRIGSATGSMVIRLAGTFGAGSMGLSWRKAEPEA